MIWWEAAPTQASFCRAALWLPLLLDIIYVTVGPNQGYLRVGRQVLEGVGW
jgi:hypothetical protein